jgi:hypothetical protein
MAVKRKLPPSHVEIKTSVVQPAAGYFTDFIPTGTDFDLL